MKRRTIIATLLLLLLVSAGKLKAQQWRELHTGVTEDLYDVCCIDTNTVFVCGQNGVILKTTDGGEIWEEKHRNPGWEIVSLQFADENIGYGLVIKSGYETFLLKTQNGGDSWARFDIVNGFEKSHSGVCYDDPLELFLAGKPIELFVLNDDTVFVRLYDEVIKSADGGITFAAHELGFSHDIGGNGADKGIRGEYFEDDYGWAIGYDEDNQNTLRVMKTENGGDNWENNANHEFSHLYIAAVFAGANRRARVYGTFVDHSGSKASCLETTDGFEHVTMRLTNGDEIGYWAQYSDVDFCLNEHGCYICSSNLDKEFYSDSHAYISDNNGVSWTEVPHGLSGNRFVYAATSFNNTFLLASQKGVLYKYDESPYLGAEDSRIEVRVFPNPAENTLEIRAKEARETMVFDPFGRKVLKLGPVRDRVVVDVSKIAPGIYSVVIIDQNGKPHREKLVKL
ncbi:MAG: T9SS type A sorting domain-containing protein [Bacteroidales bacterium]|nr:T9SS type A sorting domain-containing protein [Bacteroidales bacterium]